MPQADAVGGLLICAYLVGFCLLEFWVWVLDFVVLGLVYLVFCVVLIWL